MGSYASRIASMSNSAVHSVYRGRKRKCIEEDDFDSESDYIDRTLQTPKKRKLLTTAQYIYKTLFQEEKGSDITVLMLGKAWRLHKVYISQIYSERSREARVFVKPLLLNNQGPHLVWIRTEVYVCFWTELNVDLGYSEKVASRKYKHGAPLLLSDILFFQSPYFASMFSGSWREANETVISVEIADPNITLDSLLTVFGSFYQDEVSLEPKDVISILATSTLFQLQGLIDQCTEIMVETTNIKTVVPYYNAAVSYGVPMVKAAAKRWLEVNLLGYGWLHPTFLKEITPDLMAELIASPDLIAMQTEFCIYMMLRVWLFVHIHNKEETLQIDEYFRNHKWTEPFLITEEGREFSAPFKALRMKYLLLHDQDVKILYSDNLIPHEWLHSAYKEQWLHLLRIDANKDRGFEDRIITLKDLLSCLSIYFRPKQMSEQEFARECFRCGRCIEKAGEHTWRWTAFHFGLNLVVCLDSTTLRIKRNHRLDTDLIKANHSKHNIILKVSLISLDEQRQEKHIQSSGMLRLLLHKNEEKLVMSLNKELTYPLYISVNMQVVTPFVSTEEEKSADIVIFSDT